VLGVNPCVGAHVVLRHVSFVCIYDRETSGAVASDSLYVALCPLHEVRLELKRVKGKRREDTSFCFWAPGFFFTYCSPILRIE